MENSILIALSRQVSIKDQMDMVANNLANLKTTGFKSSGVHFREFIMPNAKYNEVPQSSKDLSYVAKSGLITDFSQGALVRTDGNLDVAIQGEGFFVVQTEQGERFTRSGNFKRADDGTISDSNGNAVQSGSGNIVIGPDENNIVIAKDGTVTSSAGIKGRLRIVKFANEGDLIGTGYGLYESASQSEDVENPQVAQHMLEQSNVKAVEQMAKMIEIMRGYARVNSIIENNHKLKKDAIGRLARIDA